MDWCDPRYLLGLLSGAFYGALTTSSITYHRALATTPAPQRLETDLSIITFQLFDGYLLPLPPLFHFFLLTTDSALRDHVIGLSRSILLDASDSRI